MSDSVNVDLFSHIYYNTITTNVLEKELLFPPVTKGTTFSNLVKKINLTVGATTPAVDDLTLLNASGDYNYLIYPNGRAISLDPTMEYIFKLIPVIVELWAFNDTYHVQTSKRDIVVTKSTFDTILCDSLSIVEHLTGENDILYKHDKYYREGVYFRVSVRSDILYNRVMYADELMELDVDLKNYNHIHLMLPEPLFTLPSFIPDSVTSSSLDAFDKRWVPMGVINDIVKRDINKVKSHVVRKFIHDIQTSVMYFFDDEYENYNNIELLMNYLERVWTDELKYLINQEFPDVVTDDFSIYRKFKKFTTLVKKGCINKAYTFPVSVKYYRDKEFILNKVVNQTCSS